MYVKLVIAKLSNNVLLFTVKKVIFDVNFSKFTLDLYI